LSSPSHRRAEEEAARQAAIDAGEDVPDAGDPPEESVVFGRKTIAKWCPEMVRMVREGGNPSWQPVETPQT